MNEIYELALQLKRRRQTETAKLPEQESLSVVANGKLETAPVSDITQDWSANAIGPGFTQWLQALKKTDVPVDKIGPGFTGWFNEMNEAVVADKSAPVAEAGSFAGAFSAGSQRSTISEKQKPAMSEQHSDEDGSTSLLSGDSAKPDQLKSGPDTTDDKTVIYQPSDATIIWQDSSEGMETMSMAAADRPWLRAGRLVLPPRTGFDWLVACLIAGGIVGCMVAIFWMAGT